MIDHNTIGAIAHEQYKRWDSAKDAMTVPHLVKRGQDRELQKAKAASKGVTVKAPPKPFTKGGAGVDKLVAGPGARSRKSKDPFANSLWSSTKGNNQPDLSRSGPAHFGSKRTGNESEWNRKPDYSKAPAGMGRYGFPKPASLPHPFNPSNKGFGQPNIHRNAPGAFSPGAHAATSSPQAVSSPRTSSFSGGVASHSTAVNFSHAPQRDPKQYAPPATAGRLKDPGTAAALRAGLHLDSVPRSHPDDPNRIMHGDVKKIVDQRSGQLRNPSFSSAQHPVSGNGHAGYSEPPKATFTDRSSTHAAGGRSTTSAPSAHFSAGASSHKPVAQPKKPPAMPGFSG